MIKVAMTKETTHSVTDIAALREDYKLASLDENDLADSPIIQFERWFNQAQSAKLAEPNAMSLATVDSDGQPSVRVVLLKGVSEQGFTFFTNYNSRKGLALANESRAALMFCWLELERQIRIEGVVTKISAAESDNYYETRPLASRLGAWASPQSQVIPSRQALELGHQDFKSRMGDSPPRPEHWGGYRLQATMIEFWQGRRSRLHDRLRYRWHDKSWIVERLAP